MRFTVIGASGFIGGEIVQDLLARGFDVYAPQRGDVQVFDRDLGHVIYAAGVTADFRKRPFDTLRAHVTFLSSLLERAEFASLLYMSSARIYRHAERGDERAPIKLLSEDIEDYYDLTKLTGEALCFNSGRKNVRVVRISNVVGEDFDSPNFIYDIIRQAQSGIIQLKSSLSSDKDYIAIKDVVRLVVGIAINGHGKIYNVASGVNITHETLVSLIGGYFGARLFVSEGARPNNSVPINISAIREEFDFIPINVIDYLGGLLVNLERRY